MDFKSFDGLTVETAINQIKQKHFTELDAGDIASLKAREAYPSENDRRMYLGSEDPVSVVEDNGNYLTRQERIINENRPRQDEEMRVRVARNTAIVMGAVVNIPTGSTERSKGGKRIAYEREERISSLVKEADNITGD